MQDNPLNEPEKALLESLRALHYGTLEVTVHNSRIVQIQRTEKLRFSENRKAGGTQLRS